MPALNACLQVARLAEAVGDSVPYLESVAKVAVLVFKLLDQKAKNKGSAKQLCESIANTILVINDLVCMQGEPESSCYIDICGEMEGYLQGMAQDLKDIKQKHCGLKGVFSVDDYRDAIQAYRRRIDDLKTDFLIHSVGDCHLEVTQMHRLLKSAIAPAVLRHSEEFVFQIPKKPVAITAFFLKPADISEMRELIRINVKARMPPYLASVLAICYRDLVQGHSLMRLKIRGGYSSIPFATLTGSVKLRLQRCTLGFIILPFDVAADTSSQQLQVMF